MVEYLKVIYRMKDGGYRSKGDLQDEIGGGVRGATVIYRMKEGGYRSKGDLQDEIGGLQEQR